MFKYEFAANLPTTLSAKNFENRLTSGEVMGKSLVSLTHGVAYILYKGHSLAIILSGKVSP